MNLSLKGFDKKNNPIDLPKILWYEHTIEKFGFYETFTIGFSGYIPSTLYRVVVTKENKKESDCFVDLIEIKADKYGLFCTVKLKNIVCRLIENEVEPTEYKSFTLEKLLKKYTKDLNIGCDIKSLYSIDPGAFYVDLGMTPFDIIFLFFQTTCKRYIFLNEDKKLTFSYSNSKPLYFGDYKKNTSKPINGIKYSSFKFLDDRSRIMSNLYVKIVCEDDKSEFLNLTKENEEAIENNIKRVRYRCVPQQWLVLPKNGCEFMVQKENKNRFTYVISTFQNVDVYPGMIARVETIDNGNELVVIKVINKLNEIGKKTKIFLKINKL